jgi:phosphatidate cytidylyltransferase
MARILSALVLLPIVVGTIWWLPPVATLLLAEVVVLLAFVEYAGLGARLGAHIPRFLAGTGTLAVCAALGWPGAPVAAVLMTATIAVGASALAGERPGPAVLFDVGASLFALLYLGLPGGAIAAIRAELGREALLALLLTIVISDTAQYYGGRALGRRLLAPAISPKKTIEGAVSGFVAGALAMLALGGWALPGRSAPAWLLLGAAVVALGITGDLFESLLKRSAGVKDASGLIPGHGGMLDRIDSLLFATPVYYLFVRYGP